jgi:hypothetical protein
LGFGVWGLECGVWCLRFRDEGLVLGAWGLEFLFLFLYFGSIRFRVSGPGFEATFNICDSVVGL